MERQRIVKLLAVLDSKQLSVVPAASVSALMAGNLAGLMAVQRSGEPGNDDCVRPHKQSGKLLSLQPAGNTAN